MTIRKVELSYMWDETDPIDAIYIDNMKCYLIVPLAKVQRLISGNCPEVLSELRRALGKFAHEPRP
jgi:hypothetical protein